MPKLQIVVDSVISEGLRRLPGKSKVDKIRWALCVYQEVLNDNTYHVLSDKTYHEIIMARAGERYRNGHSTS